MEKKTIKKRLERLDKVANPNRKQARTAMKLERMLEKKQGKVAEA